MTEVKSIAKKTRSSYVTSLVFLWIVAISTIAIHFYNSYWVAEIEKLKSSIISIESNIAEVEKEKNLQIYSLLELNKEVIESYELMNKVTKYINHMNTIVWKYNLELTGFDLVNWKIKTNIKVISDDNWIAFQKTRDFINNYRSDEKALFDLDFITGVEWMDDMKFKANFIIK